MFSKTKRSLVKGFLRAEGRKVVNGDGEEIVLTGWGLGNWLLSEGYMWLSDTARFDRPRRMEQVIQELAGTTYAASFWNHYRNNYVTREDIRLMAELGYNSVRIPFNWTILMEDEPGITWKEDGFKLLDRCIDWCEEFGLYAFLDLHGAPGGQTGSNIDDSIDDFPRLFTDEDSWYKCIELWEELARRYADRWIVGGYDLLNEPIRPGIWEDKYDYYLLQRLSAFYDEAIAAIRAIDPHHLLSIEGHRWATDTSIFYKRYDDNMVIHFHRYACMPSIEHLSEFIALSERLDQPLWLGETGENIHEWFAAFFPLSVSLNIGYNLWPWKKMDCLNSPYSVNKPDGWDELLLYANGGPRPSYERTQHILDQYLENMKVEHCAANPDITAAVFRRAGSRVRGTDFDQFPGKGISFSGLRAANNIYNYRMQTGMTIMPIDNQKIAKRFTFDCGWDQLVLELRADEFASYSFQHIEASDNISLELGCTEDAVITISQNGQSILESELSAKTDIIQLIADSIIPAENGIFTIHVNSGAIQLHTVSLQRTN